MSICKFLRVEPAGLMLSLAVGHTTCSASFLNQETKTGKVLSPRWVQRFEHAVGQCCFQMSPVLAGNIEFSGAFRQPSSFASAPQVGFT